MTSLEELDRRLDLVEERQHETGTLLARMNTLVPRLERTADKLETGIEKSAESIATIELAAARRNGRISSLEREQKQACKRLDKTSDIIDSLPCAEHESIIKATEKINEGQGDNWNRVLEMLILVVTIILSTGLSYLVSNGLPTP